MKRKSLLHSGIVVLMVQFLFSCSSAEYYRFAPTQQEAYKKVKEKPVPAANPEAGTLPAEESAAVAAQITLPSTEPDPALEANAKATKPVLYTIKKASVNAAASQKSSPISKTELSPEEIETLAQVQNQLAHLNKIQKKEIKNSLREVLKEAADETQIVEIILAVLIPPLAVFLHEDGINNRFWISLLLTILFFIPGVIYALLVVTDSI